MLWLIIGLVIFMGVHVLTSMTASRARVIAVLGEGAYKGLYSVLSIVGCLPSMSRSAWCCQSDCVPAIRRSCIARRC